MPDVLIDVVIPAFNAEKTIESAVRSIFDQTLGSIRVIVVNDGSQDGTADILSAMAEADPRLIVHTQPNGGIVDALNAGLSLCRAPFVARHDADDIAYPSRLESQLKWLVEHPDAVAVGANVRHIDASGRATGTHSDLRPPEQADLTEIPAKEPYIIHPFLLVRRQAMVDVGGYRYVHHSEDSDLYWRLQEIGGLHNLEEVLGEYRLHDASISGKSAMNGRIMSIYSQLAALSAARRRAGVADFVFEKGMLKAFQQAGTIENMLALLRDKLTPEERARLEIATAAKFLELASYRPWKIDVDDCRFVKRVARRDFRSLMPHQRALLVRQISGISARLFYEGSYSQARQLLPRRYYLQGMARLLYRAIREMRALRQPPHVEELQAAA